MSDRYIPKLTLEITDEQSQKLRQLIPWGAQSRIFRAIIDQLISMVEKHGDLALGALISGNINFFEVNSNGNDRRPAKVDLPDERE